MSLRYIPADWAKINMKSGISIAIDAFRLISEPHTSGAFVISEIVREIQHRPEINKITLLLPRKPDSGFLFKDLPTIEKVNILFPEKQYFPEKNFRGNILWVQFIIPRLLKNVRITHLISPYHQTPVFLRRSIKVITIINDLCGLLPSAGYFYHKKGPYRHWFNFLTALARADAIAYISIYTKNTFEHAFPYAKQRPSLVIYPKPTFGDHPDELEIEKIIYNLELRFKEYFFAFGTGGLRKGADVTLKAFDLYQKKGGKKKLALLVPFSSLGYMKKLIQGSSSSIILMSELSNSQRDAVYAGAIALLFPSRCEGYGYPILEALYLGCPPIALQNSPAGEIIEGCVPALDKLNIDNIVNLMFDYEERTVTSRRDLELSLKLRANEFITKINTSQKYVELIQSIK